MKKPYFKLMDETWIPCIYLDGNGQPTPLSLRQTLAEAHRIREIYTDSPLIIAALHRLLLAVLHRTFGPKDPEAWKNLWRPGQWDLSRLEERFSEWHSHFYLFHDQWPFYQVTRFPPLVGEGELLPIAALSIELASSHNTMMFDHSFDHAPKIVSPPEAARRLVTYQAYSIGFGISYGSRNTAVHFTDSPCVRGAFFFIEGKNLFQSLLLNMRCYPESTSRLPDDPQKDCVAWEQDRNKIFGDTRKLPFGYLDFLTWQSRQVCLIPSENGDKVFVSHVRRVQGRQLDKEKVLDPLKSYRLDKTGKPIVRGFSLDKALWRDSEALFSLGNTLNIPENFILLSRLVDDGFLQREMLFQYLTLGLAMGDKAASVALWRSERMPLSLNYLNNQSAVTFLHEALNRAEHAETAIRQATDWLAWLWVKEKDHQWGSSSQANIDIFRDWRKSKDYTNRNKAKDFTGFREHFPVERDYWWRLEQPFRKLMPRFADEDETQAVQAIQTWCDEIRHAAQSAWNLTAESLEFSPRTLRVRAKAEEVLRVELEHAINPK